MFRGMGLKLPSDKAVKLLDYRGQKELARRLKRCWLEEYVHDVPYVDRALANIRVHAPLEEYELLRNLSPADRDKLLTIFKELYSSDSLDVVNIDFELETDNPADEELITAIEEQKSLMISVATGERPI